jgi:urea ABC transporter permease protein UrtC
VTKLGYIATFAIVAIGLDLLWGYCGAMSLCQALFFAIGAYCMGFYLINTGPQVGGIPEALTVVMSDVSNPTPPWYLNLFETFTGTVILGLLLPALAAFLIGVATFRSRVKGVYFAILTQAITVGAFFAMQQNDLKMGGTNGLNFYDNILGFQLAADPDAGPLTQTRFWLYIASVTGLLITGSLAFAFTRSGLGRVMLAMRDDETRLRFNGYTTWVWKTVVLVIAGVFAGLAGMLYTPQKPLINPNELAAFASIMVVAHAAFGGRATVWGAAAGAILISLLYDWITSFWPDGWMFVLGAIFIAVPLFLPGGLMSLVFGLARLCFPTRPENIDLDDAPAPEAKP